MDPSSDEDLYRDSSPGDHESEEEPIAGPVPPDAAPRYSVPNRVLGAVEIPAVVQNVDRAVKAFGRVPSLQHVRPLLLLTMPISQHLYALRLNQISRLWILLGTQFPST